MSLPRDFKLGAKVTVTFKGEDSEDFVEVHEADDVKSAKLWIETTDKVGEFQMARTSPIIKVGAVSKRTASLA